MKAKKIKLDSYEIDARTPEGNIVKMPYDVRTSISDLILAPQLKLNGSRLLKNSMIASKIIGCKESFILLELNEYAIIRGAVDLIDGFSKNDVELVKRITEAEEVEVEEKK